MSYVVFARRYRPSTFDEVVGQSHITTTLKNAIEQERVAHAYLFSGPRGVGKTTTARIFAKALDCEKGPRPEPCNACAICEEIAKGSSLDILEIDGASNRGIEEIRNLRENVKFAPSKGRFKVYIIDEVHMLTAEAFNALLKTLEEPPPHVIFIFATTQVHKVPATILSRCQRFDFRRITARDIFENLKMIVKKEKLSIDDDALLLVAKHADGSMRDGQVVLDQIVSFAEGKVGVGDVEKVLGIVDEEILFALTGSIKAKDTRAALETVARLVDEGKDAAQVVLGLIEHFRNLAILKSGSQLAALIEAGPDRIKRYAEQAERFTIEEILYIVYTLSNTLDTMRTTGLARIPLEVAVIKLTKMAQAMSLVELTERLEALEGRPLSSGVPAKAPQAPARQAPQEQTPRPSRQEGQRPAPPPPLDRKGPAAAASPGPASSTDLTQLLEQWSSVIDRIRARKISVASYLEEGTPTGLEGGKLSISFPKEQQFHKEALDSTENRALIEKAIKDVLQVELRVILALDASTRQLHGSGPERRDRDDLSSGGDDEPAPKSESIDPIIKNALEIFDGEIPKRDVYNNRGKAR